MLTTSGRPRLWIEDNSFLVKGDPGDMECPPNGRLLDVRYDNGDAFKIEFYEVDSLGDLATRLGWPDDRRAALHLPPFPVTCCDISFGVGGTQIHFTPHETRLPGANTFKGGYFSQLDIAIKVGS